MNNVIYCSGYLQNVIIIDENVFFMLDVSYGFGVLVYGSDVIGGFIYFKIKNLFFIG